MGSSLTLSQLRAFVAVVDHGGFVAAADELGVTQSSVSHALASLERLAGGPVVERTQPVEPTALGAALLDHARSALASARAFEAVTAELADPDRSTTCSIAVSRTAARGLLPDLMKAWHAHIPNLELNVYEGVGAELEGWLHNGLVDAAILIDPANLPPDGLLVATDSLGALVPGTHRLADRVDVQLEDLLDDPMLSCTSGCELYVKRVYADAGTTYAPAQRIRDLTTLISMVEAGRGVSIVPSLTAALVPPTLTLIPLRPVIERRLTLCGPDNRPWHPAVAALQSAAQKDLPLPLDR